MSTHEPPHLCMLLPKVKGLCSGTELRILRQGDYPGLSSGTNVSRRVLRRGSLTTEEEVRVMPEEEDSSSHC